MSEPCPLCGQELPDDNEAWLHFQEVHAHQPQPRPGSASPPSRPPAAPASAPARPPAATGPPPAGGIWRQGYANAPATMTIIAVTIAVWIGHLLIQKLGGVNTDNTLAGNGLLGTDGQWWRLVTPLVVHFGFVHIAFNMAWLYQLGPAIERIMGRVGLVATYLATGVAGNVCSDAVYYHRANFLSGGASGSVYGLGGVLIGAWLVGRRLDRRRAGPPPSGALLFNDEVVRSLAVLFGAYLVITVVFLRGVDTAAHFGGGLLGLAIGAAVVWRHNGPRARLSST